jgi:hypothetical protein
MLERMLIVSLGLIAIWLAAYSAFAPYTIGWLGLKV